MLEAAVDIVEGRAHAFDVGKFNDDFFVYIAAFGLFTDVSYETNQDLKNILGHAAYILEGTQRLLISGPIIWRWRARNVTWKGNLSLGW